MLLCEGTKVFNQIGISNDHLRDGLFCNAALRYCTGLQKIPDKIERFQK